MRSRLGLLIGLLCLTSEIAHSDTISSLFVAPNSITLTIPITIVGADPDVLANWQRSIERVWNHGNDGEPFTYCGRDVIFDARFQPSAAPRNAKTSHLVIVQDVKPGDQYVSSVWHALGTSPSYSPRTGFWGSNMDGETTAHEFGHLLGLLDEYVETDPNKNGLREPGERPVPDVRRYPDALFSVMANERGVALQRHIREVIRMHGGVVCPAR
jgi:hypothetical protein